MSSTSVHQWLDTELPGLAREFASGARSFSSLMAACGAAGVQSVAFDDTGAFHREATLSALSSTARLTEDCPQAAVANWSTRVQAMILAMADATFRNRLLAPVLQGATFGSIAISEDGAGTDLRGMETVFDDRGEVGTVSGSKTWLTLGPLADFSLVLAKARHRDRDADMVLLLVERDMPGVKYSEDLGLVSYPGLPMGQLTMDGTPVPRANILVAEAALPATVEIFNYARLEAASHGCGLQRTCLRALAEHVNERAVSGMPLSKQSHVRRIIGDLRTKLAASEALTYRAGERYADGSDNTDLPAMAKVFATDAAAHGSELAMSLMGSFGLDPSSRVGRIFLDAKGAQVVDGTSDILRLNVARAMTRREAGFEPGDEVALRLL